MYVIVGLGNPGKKYAHTRHNMGFITVDHFAQKMNVEINKIKFKALVGEMRLSGHKVLLVKPQTFMNLSGSSLAEIMNFYKVDHDKLLVIYDDLDIETGSIRIRKKGSAGTHNGMRSIVSRLGFDDFPRIRIGIGSNGRQDIIDYVTGGFSKDEVGPLEKAVEQSCEAIKCYIEEGIEKAMNRYNGEC